MLYVRLKNESRCIQKQNYSDSFCTIDFLYVSADIVAPSILSVSQHR
ncbi:hypothetical protein [Rubritalea tangerina]